MAGGRILVIEDEPTIRNACRMILGEAGLDVVSCESGREGRDRLLSDAYDVVLLDVKLTDLDGMDILTAARDHRVPSRIVVITGYSTSQNAIEAMNAGAFDYLSKPFTEDMLVESVFRALAAAPAGNEEE